MNQNEQTAAHTKGPWHVDEVTTPNGTVYEVNAVTDAEDDDGETIMVNVAECREFVDGQDVANARLIAASPDLLAAILPLLDIVEDELAHDSEPEDLTSWHRAIADARSAITKAEGVSQ